MDGTATTVSDSLQCQFNIDVGKTRTKKPVQGARTKFIARHSGRESRLRVFMLLMTTSVSEGVPNKFEKVGTFGLCEEYQFF